MNITDYTYLINNPNNITEKHVDYLGTILDEFPFFQSARALRLKGLYNQNSFKYNYALKVTAAHTTDRSVLFDFITSGTFTATKKGLYHQKATQLLDINVVDSEIILPETKPRENAIEQPILSPVKDLETLKEINTEVVSEKLDIGKPLDFSVNEKHSFQEWLQIARIEPIVRDTIIEKNTETFELDEEKRKKLELIDKFIETNPKISPMKQTVSIGTTLELNKTDNSYLMTETLARVYLEQKKYQKAIQAYEILILKYPEKSSFFANRISDIEILQHTNNK